MAVYPNGIPNIPITGWTHDQVAQEIEAIATELGTDPKGSYADVKTRLDNLTTGKPYQFFVSAHGAKGDGILITDVGTTNGSGVLTSPSNGFTGATVGQWVMVNTSQDSICGQITTVTSASQVTISTNAQSTETGLFAVWGTDDATAINSALVAARDYAEAHGFYAEVLLDDKIYIVATENNISNTYETANTQIHIPSPTNNDSRKLVLALKGVGRVDHLQYWNATVPMLAGTAIVSVAPRVTYGSQTGSVPYKSVIGASWGNTDMGLNAGGTQVFVNHKPIIENLAVVMPYKNGRIGLDFTRSGGMYADGVSVFSFASALKGTGLLLDSWWSTFGNEYTMGMRLPDLLNNADVALGNISFEGLYQGLVTPTEHVTIQTIRAIYMGIVLGILVGSGHGLTIDRVTAEAYQGGVSNLSGATGKSQLRIGLWSTENSGTAYDFSDAGNALYGEIHWSDSVDARNLVVSGAANLRIINDSLGPGNWASPPAVPASTTAQQNTAWRDAAVSIIGGTVSNVKVAGVTVATGTNTTVFVPSGKTITLTYSAAPTWAWTLY